jgi:hypothetical protein
LRVSALAVGAFEVVVVGCGVDVALVAQVLERVVHVVAIHTTTDLKNMRHDAENNLRKKYFPPPFCNKLLF